MPSMTETMSAMRFELSEMPCMVWTTWPTVCPPRCATSMLTAASWLAWAALSAFCFTVAASCSMVAAVCSSAAACSSVRLDRLALPAAISAEPMLISSTPWRTVETVRVRPSCMRLSAANRAPISLLERVSTRLVRSPPAMRSKCMPASRSGSSTPRRMKAQHNAASSRAVDNRAMAEIRAEA